MIERVGRATAEAVQFIRNPANKKSVLQTMVKQLRISTPDRAEPFYTQLVEELPRNICPTTSGVRSILKLMADLGINPKTAGMKAEDVIDLGLCKRLGGDGR